MYLVTAYCLDDGCWGLWKFSELEKAATFYNTLKQQSHVYRSIRISKEVTLDSRN